MTIQGARLDATDSVTVCAFTTNPSFRTAPRSVRGDVQPYVFTSADTLNQSLRAMYAPGNGSTCKVLVPVEPIEAVEIRDERVYFHAETLGSRDR